MYSAKIEGQPTTFGTSGLVYRSNKLMYDRATETLWNSFLGEPVIGPLAGSGIRLDLFPVVLTTWEEWLDEHPDTTVLSIYTGIYDSQVYRHEADPRSPYYEYRNTRGTMFAVPFRDDRFGVKEEVLGVSSGGSHKAYPVTLLRAERVVNDVVGGLPVVIVASPVSSAARVYAGGEQSFEPEEGQVGVPRRLVDSAGTVWNVGDGALMNTDDPADTLPRIPASVSYWFGWFGFHPDTEVYEGR